MRDAPPIPCRSLRTKMFAIDQTLGRAYLERTVATEHYWCLRTMGPAGPDEAPVEPACCLARRGCYQPMAPREAE